MNIENALLVQTVLKTAKKEDLDARKDELFQLVKTLGSFEVVGEVSKKMDPNLHSFLGSGTIDELISVAKEKNAKAIVIGNILKPRQLYEISKILHPHKMEVWDKIDLILKIFSMHAESAEAKLQIQLARIRHTGPRIFGLGGEELSKQGGGGFTTRGAGETNTEIMKRHLQKEERKILEKLEEVQKTKNLQRKEREKRNSFTVALVGYTNAGKSSLMNVLSKKNVGAENALFKTLDTRIGKMFLPSLQEEIFISDTIGFIADLPPNLISAFKSTLAEAMHADVLLHVVDTSHHRRDEHIAVVDDILKQLGLSEKPQILVFNKIDTAGKRFGKINLKKQYAEKNPVFVSAIEKLGILELKEKIAEEKQKKENHSFL